MGKFDYSEEKYKREQAERRLHFARFCWKHRNELTTEGRITWEKRFEQMEGISLQNYAKQRMKERNQKEKKLSHNK